MRGTIHLIVSYNAGGSSDTLARVTISYWGKAIEAAIAKLGSVTLGIPGNEVTAALLGGLMIHGIIPTPMQFQEAPGGSSPPELGQPE